MAKIDRGRLDGVYGMRGFSFVELYALADEIEHLIDDPDNSDDPRWLRRRVKKLRKLAEKKEKAFEHKTRQQ